MPPKKNPGAAAGKKPRAAPKSAHKLAPPLPEGEVLTDFTKKRQWKMGKVIGFGGFGQLYLVSEVPAPCGPDAPYVMKIEPHSNGPLFCELHFYQRVAKPELIKKWMAEHKMKTLGMPKFIAAGSHEKNHTKYRFMVMERFNTDLQKMFEKNGKRFSRKAVLQLGIRLIHVLEYIHDHEYCHADIKASNLLTGFAKGTTDQVYLVDYGLAFRYTSDGKHKEYKEDPRKTHDGTIEFTSRDAHKGVTPSRRGDMEILGYCLLQWLCGTLPWEDNLNNKEYVRDQKIMYMKDIPKLMRTCFPGGDAPAEIADFLKCVSNLDYDERPDYDHFSRILTSAMKKLGYKDDKLDLDVSASAAPVKSKSKKASAKRPVSTTEEDDTENEEDFEPQAKQRTKPSTPKPRTPKPGKQSSSSCVRSPLARVATPQKVIFPEVKYPEEMYPDAANARTVGAAARVKAEEGLVHGSPIKKSKSALARKKKELKDRIEVATQTSPGLKGLRNKVKTKR